MHETFFTDPRSWVAIAFVIFVLVFGRKIWAALAAMLDKRAETIRAELAEAQRYPPFYFYYLGLSECASRTKPSGRRPRRC